MSIKIGRFLGIDLFIHWSFWLLPLWVVYTQAGDEAAGPLALQLGLLGALFGFVVLHEYGHAMMARFFGIATRDVTLYPIGGVARLERMSEKPWEEFWIAVAGPLVNVALAAGFGVMLLAGVLVAPNALSTPIGELLTYLVVMNLMLFGFNLLPAFPMDGGRVLRALLTIPMGRVAATRVSVYVSIGFAVLLSVGGVLFLNNPMLIFIGLFLVFAGTQELFALERREQHRNGFVDEEGPEIPRGGHDARWTASPGRPVTVYVWDGRRQEWIAQGAIQSPLSGGR